MILSVNFNGGVKMAIKKTTRDIVGASIGLGVGGITLGALAPSMPAGTSGPLISAVGKGGAMMGAVIPAAYGMEVLKMLKPKKRRRR